jgi:hypothetical protein
MSERTRSLITELFVQGWSGLLNVELNMSSFYELLMDWHFSLSLFYTQLKRIEFEYMNLESVWFVEIYCGIMETTKNGGNIIFILYIKMCQSNG